MKHLKKFNEDIEYNKLDHEYIKNCFIDFIDMGSELYTELDREDFGDYKPGELPLYGINGEEVYVSSYVELCLSLPYLKDRNNLKEYTEYTKKLTELLLDIQNSIDKVKLKYPDIKYIFVNSEGSEEIILYI